MELLFSSIFSICSVSLGFCNSLLVSNFEQPERLRTVRELSPKMIFRLRKRFIQFLKFRESSSLRVPMDGSMRTIFVHPSRSRSLRCGTPLKSGISIRFWEYLRSRISKLGRYYKRNQSMKVIISINFKFSFQKRKIIRCLF